MEDSRISDYSKLIQQTFEDIVDFVFRSLRTTLNLFFRPLKILDSCYKNNHIETALYSRPIPYLIIVLILFAITFDAIKGALKWISVTQGMHDNTTSLLETMFIGRWYTDHYGLVMLIYLAPPVLAVVAYAKTMSFVFFRGEDREAAKNYLIYTLALPIFTVVGLLLFLMSQHRLDSIILAIHFNREVVVNWSTFPWYGYLLLFVVGGTAPVLLPFRSKHKVRFHAILYGLVALIALPLFAKASVNYSFWLSTRYSNKTDKFLSIGVSKGQWDKATNRFIFDVVIQNQMNVDFVLSDAYKISMELLNNSNLDMSGRYETGVVISGFTSNLKTVILQKGETAILQAAFDNFTDENKKSKDESSKRKNDILSKKNGTGVSLNSRSSIPDKSDLFAEYKEYNIYLDCRIIDKYGQSTRGILTGSRPVSIPGWMRKLDHGSRTNLKNGS